ncbi:hypothetical protein C8F04DRAFT_339001 [Mycena alexandri]|uniref:Uncharacterized protein n=1 Tax=Mycena alexandri TaxID=1745969 RepID=A0AAD6XF78_9AGAR|nr:hypothetical protein C8F04DRAFT_339001 [Mycena alexandri]
MSLSVAEINSVLPPYAPSAVVPSYSPEPGDDERLLEQAPRMKPRIFSGNHTKKSGRDTVVLTAQDEHANVPTYGRTALIGGSVSLEDRESVSKVALEIKGTIEFTVAGSTVTQTILAEHCIIWAMEHSAGAACPGTIPFATLLPAQFEHNKTMYPLPPSYFVSYASSGGVYIKVVYSLAVTVSRARGRKLAFLSAKNTIFIPFTYSPRTRPGRPIAPLANDFLADLKIMPEEFHELTLAVRPRPKVLLQPVDVQLFTPSADVFPLDEPIPIHIQLTGTTDSLREFLPGADGALPRSRVEVRLLRQMTMLVNGHKEPCQVAVGSASLMPMPPTVGAQEDWDGVTASLDWAGVLRCDAGLSVGSFDAGLLRVQDFIVLDILEPAGPKSQFARARQPRPIRLVTDPWPDA